MPSPAPASSTPSPLPPPAPADARRRRRRHLLPPSFSSSAATPTSTSRASATSSSSGSSSSSSASSSGGGLSFFSPAPSPFHYRFLSPLRTSAVPFSWEHRPGIPKTPARQQARPGGKPGAKTLPLPPSLLSSKVGAADDPFVSPDAAGGHYLIAPEGAKTSAKGRCRRRRQQPRRRRPPALAATLTDWLAVLSLYRSCKRSRDCLAGTPPRPRSPPAKAAAA